ncbi:gliding motility-associated C-terminal domain-containing protein [Spirosoma sp. SC4-14]|uniref:gliding motility-associated C-terminal domain-containing protein n=1 Tax=Spirosoma sp. SC4-14 TaxID=3128900 RepID=UPI0030D26E92
MNAIASATISADTCQHPEPPVIAGTAKEICRNDVVTLTATGCVGTVVWSNGATGNSIDVRPQQTTKYTAICRARQGCISCFADVWKITVHTPDSPAITASSALICAGDAVQLTATNCSGTVRWPDQTTGLVWTGNLTQTSVFTATCQQNQCVSNPSTGALVQVASPAIPVLVADKTEICVGQSVRLTASNCIGTVRWSDGNEGIVHSVSPNQTMSYRAVCQIGSCRSDSSASIPIIVRASDQKLLATTSLINKCPFQTADLSTAIQGNSHGLYYSFRTGASFDSPIVQSPGAVKAGVYYIFGRSSTGCYTEPVSVTVRIGPCQNAITPCISDPATVAIRLDTLNWTKGVVYLRGKLGGSAESASWSSSGGGLFTDDGLNTRYLLSETDRQRGSTTFTLTVSDPDASGPCVGTSTQLTIGAPALTQEVVGLSKKVSKPVWLIEGTTKLVELTYLLTVVNLGKHALTKLQISDNLDAVFTATGARLYAVSARADNGLTINEAYTGQGADTTLLAVNNQLPAGAEAHVWLTVRMDVSQATTLTFANRAAVNALDTNGRICRDISTNGISTDPDQNGDPTDNNEPTSITLHSLQPEEEATTVFIPEGFSPNGDGINDYFVVQRLPAGVTIQLEIYNRWGSVVYRNNNYKNDWDGTANQGIKTTTAMQGLPDGTYYYQIKLSDGREFVRFLTLAR